MTALLDEQEFDLDFLDIKGVSAVVIVSWDKKPRFSQHYSYEEDLRKQFVIADPREREQMIVDQIKVIEAEHGVRIEIDAELLERSLELWLNTQLPLWEVLMPNTLRFQKKSW